MKLLLSAALSAFCVLSAQTPDLSGVWKANLEKSKIGGPPPTTYLMIVEQKDGKLKETMAAPNQRGENRAMFTYNLEGKPAVNSLRGIPMQTQGAWQGSTLVLTSKVAGRPTTIVEKWTLSPDGNTLTVDNVSSTNGKDTQQLLVLEKQPDSAAEMLRKPEQTAGEHYKNVTALKTLPASQFMDAMRNFSMSLGVECEHCHVQGKFDADDKPTKAMARKMIAMTHGINEQTFGGRNEVKCYTCHKGQADPASRPAF